jgi:hypothetical protein
LSALSALSAGILEKKMDFDDFLINLAHDENLRSVVGKLSRCRDHYGNFDYEFALKIIKVGIDKAQDDFDLVEPGHSLHIPAHEFEARKNVYRQRQLRAGYRYKFTFLNGNIMVWAPPTDKESK